MSALLYDAAQGSQAHQIGCAALVDNVVYVHTTAPAAEVLKILTAGYSTVGGRLSTVTCSCLTLTQKGSTEQNSANTTRHQKNAAQAVSQPDQVLPSTRAVISRIVDRDTVIVEK